MDDEASRRSAREASTTPLPPERAFVVQLRAQSGPTAELFVGRVEHLASGAAEHFASATALITFIASVLAPEASAGPASASTPTSEMPGDSASSGEKP